jgi:hypothetical protein
VPNDSDVAEDIRSMDQLGAWTARRMLQLGVPEEDALVLARAGVSWHDVERLVQRGCPPELVVRVL